MKDDSGKTITDAELLQRVHKLGAIVVCRGPVEALDFATWRLQLRQAATQDQVRLSIRQLPDARVLVNNPDHVVTDEQRRAAVAAVETISDVSPEPEQPPAGRLQIVREPDASASP
ncbi:hypothetical protein [Jatrophihabitans sp. GAS493]|uniref:hypothetical protein n=1 Tax=Jatrophihabitans sp. GAS493 TaxID=1907575 RepID=UPI000BB9A818|nr:hypothetical protein [Jatrophihabitans sp. GAS493]